ncbi:hypothetical protein, partial [Rhodopirellula sp. UBA1907]|uniref:hypothetical protein n=1 Tax=Rhodopirellula sp. UBA1907 TaxID=1947381 RepID=UPI0025795096
AGLVDQWAETAGWIAVHEAASETAPVFETVIGASLGPHPSPLPAGEGTFWWRQAWLING